MDRRQASKLLALAIAFWAVAAVCFHLDPGSIQAGWRGDLAFLISLPGAWLCVRCARRVANLEVEQLVWGTALVVGTDTLLDAAALRWMPWIYGADASGRALAAAWLLWGYGASLAAAFSMAHMYPDRRAGDGGFEESSSFPQKQDQKTSASSLVRAY